MSSTFTASGLLIFLAIIVLSALFSTIMLSMVFSANSLYSLPEFSSKIKTRIKIVFCAKVSDSEVEIWVKNLGEPRIPPKLIESSLLFFGPEGDFEVMPYGRTKPPYWTYSIIDLDGDNCWGPTETLKLTIKWSTSLPTGKYYVKFSLYGVCETTESFELH